MIYCLLWTCTLGHKTHSMTGDHSFGWWTYQTSNMDQWQTLLHQINYMQKKHSLLFEPHYEECDRDSHRNILHHFIVKFLSSVNSQRYYLHQLPCTYSRDLVLQGDSKAEQPSRCRLPQLLNLLKCTCQETAVA